MEYVFYADVFWLQNTLMHTVILLILARARKRTIRKSLWKAFIIAAIGGLIETLFLCKINNYQLFMFFSFLIMIPVMVLLFLKKYEMKYVVQNVLLCYAITIGLGGILIAVENLFDIFQIPFLMAVIGFFIAEGIFRNLYSIVAKQKKVFSIKLQHESLEVVCDGFWDSGNLLVDPYQKRPVHIIDKKLAEKLLSNKKNYIGVIPFQALGTECGIVEVYEIEKMVIYDLKKEYIRKQALIAIAKEALFEGKEYQMIIHSTIFDFDKNWEGN